MAVGLENERPHGSENETNEERRQRASKRRLLFPGVKMGQTPSTTTCELWHDEHFQTATPANWAHCRCRDFNVPVFD